MIRRRGYLQLIDTDPSLVTLPPRSLPVYVLDAVKPGESDFDRSLRRMAMLGHLRRSGVRHLVILSDADAALPAELASLIDASFHPYLTFISDTDSGHATSLAWAQFKSSGPPAQLIRLSPSLFVKGLVESYSKTYPADSTIVRMRTLEGTSVLVDLTSIDDVERPISAFYDVIQQRDLGPVSPEDLTEAEFAQFFEGNQESWRPYAAGVPWMRDPHTAQSVERMLRRLDTVGSAENSIAYISSQPGAGGTTLVRMIAYEAARAGYPTLVARPIPFPPDALPVVGYMTRAHQAFLANIEENSNSTAGGADRRLYETPWIIVFDRAHWEHREGELRHFLAELTKGGRPALVLTVTGPIRPIEFYRDATSHEIAAPNHLLSPEEVEALGRHLNRFLRVFGKFRPLEAWMHFYNEHSVQHVSGVAAFWVVLSFWLRSSRDITGSVQEWIYQAFLEYGNSTAMKSALVEVAALSSERLPLNEDLLPTSDNEWPLSLRLEDARQNLSALGLVKVNADGERYWGLAHDVLGRLLLNALFHDFSTRNELGYADARDAEHLRFLALKRIAIKPKIAEGNFRALAEQYATSIFKIDPDHGARAFANIWREVLEALDQMPRLLRDSSRVFRHHTAISRRRIATFDNPIYGVSDHDRIELLERAIEDIRYALTSIDRLPGEEPDLNLYNSLANAYLNLADVLTKQGIRLEEVSRLRQLANEATRRAYADNPTNPWVVETHIKNLISIARSDATRAVEAALEALLAVYEALRQPDSKLRTEQLAQLGEQAFNLLSAHMPSESMLGEPQTPVDVLLVVWRILATSGVSGFDETLSQLPVEVADEVLTALAHKAGRGDIQVLRLRYGILSSAHPYKFGERIALVEDLQATDHRLSLQLQLEYALLLYQVGRAAEGDKQFRRLRQRWRETEYFVSVPEPLNWLRSSEATDLLIVQARIGSDQSFRPMARVSEFGNQLVPFRPEEFNVRHVRPGHPFRAHVSFGHNGPFLRPTTAGPRRN